MAKLPPSFAADYIKAVKLLSRKHKVDDADTVKRTLRLLKHMSQEAYVAGRGDIYIPTPAPRIGYYPIIEDVPYTMVRRAIRSNTSSKERARSWGVVAASMQPFVPLFARRPGSLNEMQRRHLLSHVLVSLPFVKGRTPALLGKRVPGELEMADVGTRSIIPIKRMEPGEFRGFQPLKFNLSEQLTRASKRVPKPKAVLRKVGTPNIRETMARAVEESKRPKVVLDTDAVHESYLFDLADRLCYDDGFQEWWRRQKHRAKRGWKRTKRFVTGTVIPAAVRGATVGTAEVAHTEIGLPPTTIDMAPVRRISLKRAYDPYPNLQLQQLMGGLRKQMTQEPDEVIKRALEKKLGDIAAEIAARRGLFMGGGD